MTDLLTATVTILKKNGLKFYTVGVDSKVDFTDAMYETMEGWSHQQLAAILEGMLPRLLYDACKGLTVKTDESLVEHALKVLRDPATAGERPRKDDIARVALIVNVNAEVGGLVEKAWSPGDERNRAFVAAALELKTIRKNSDKTGRELNMLLDLKAAELLKEAAERALASDDEQGAQAANA